nr:MarR family transcriptional regulator [Actinomyces sp.]
MASAQGASERASQGGAGSVAVTGCGQDPVPGQEAPETLSCGQGVAEEPAHIACGQERAGACGQASPRLLSAREMAAWRAFLAASVGVTASLNHELEAGAGISMHEYEILVRLSEAPGHSLRMSALADHVSHSRSRLTHTVGRLEKEGYVERSSCSSDRRGVNCHLTPAGLSFLRTAAPIHLDGVRRHVIERLDPSELEPFTSMLTALADSDEQL